MWPYRFVEIDGSLASEVLRNLNALDPTFPPLTDDHLEDGWWYVLKDENGTLCGFAGMVDMLPFIGVAYLKRAYVSPDHRGRGLQLQMIEARVAKARDLGRHQLVAETTNPKSAHNLRLAGFEQVEPEQFWAGRDALYFSKLLTRPVA